MKVGKQMDKQKLTPQTRDSWPLRQQRGNGELPFEHGRISAGNHLRGRGRRRDYKLLEKQSDLWIPSPRPYHPGNGSSPLRMAKGEADYLER